jgi:hypothetical protein
MTIWTWPRGSVPGLRSFRLRAKNISAIASQTDELVPGGLIVQKFEAKLTVPDLGEEHWREHSGLFAELCGTGGRLRLWDHARTQPYYNELAAAQANAEWDGGGLWSDGGGWEAGLLPPFVVVAATARRGDTSLLLKEFPPSLSGVLRRGDLFEARPNGIPADHGHLYEVTRWSNSNADGMARVNFRAGLRKGLRIGDMIVIGGADMYPSTVFRLASDDEGDIEVRAPSFGSFGVSLVEILPHT